MKSCLYQLHVYFRKWNLLLDKLLFMFSLCIQKLSSCGHN
uniref:Uncharacterized protein n=1 Tax=Rhizophora mucronata TaxID=61149 RepID=A0A2P2N980_RHIMU